MIWGWVPFINCLRDEATPGLGRLVRPVPLALARSGDSEPGWGVRGVSAGGTSHKGHFTANVSVLIRHTSWHTSTESHCGRCPQGVGVAEASDLSKHH